MKPTAKPVSFNPFLGMAVKGMWSTTFSQSIIEAIEQDDPEPTPESEAASAVVPPLAGSSFFVRT